MQHLIGRFSASMHLVIRYLLMQPAKQGWPYPLCCLPQSLPDVCVMLPSNLLKVSIY